MGPLSFTGQPNAMGGREVGGLANQLAAHMGFDDVARDRLGRFWDTPSVAPRPGLKAVDLFESIRQKQVKAVWIIATNPAVSLPDSALVREALEVCDFVVVSDCIDRTDTTRHADVRLPALAWAEKDGTVTNSERRISRQRAVLPPPGEARADWWMLCEVAKRLGHTSAFSFRNVAEIFREHATLSAFENGGSRDFDIGGLVHADYDGLTPVQWPVLGPVPAAAEATGTPRLFADGRFYHADSKARFVAVRHRPPATATTDEWPLILNTGRMRDQWHTMTRTGKSPLLATHTPDPCLAIHPDDARQFGLEADGWAEIISPQGAVTLRVTLDDGQRRGEVFAPIHWNDQFAGHAVVGRLVAPIVDPISGQPELKFTPVRVRSVALFWEATLLCRGSFTPLDDSVCWSRAAGHDHAVYRLAGREPIINWRGWAQAHLGTGSWMDYQDRGLGLYRAALLAESRLDAVLLVAPPQQRPSSAGIAELFALPSLDLPTRAALLSGTTATRKDVGAIVCACHQVGRNTILDAVMTRNLTTVEEIGACLRAGTNCGSCIPELRSLIQQANSSDNRISA
jgi:assimilatory nitrate reductase catalytic subunit